MKLLSINFRSILRNVKYKIKENAIVSSLFNSANLAQIKGDKRVFYYLAGIVLLFLILLSLNNLVTHTKKEIEINTQDSNITNVEEDIKEKTSITVYISGAIVNPGVYSLPEGSRIVDAITKAGGLKDNADTSSINLASLLEDSMHIIVNVVGEITENSTTSSVSGGTNSAKVNINTASLEQLTTLNGIGQATAEKIIAYRNKNGKFSSINDLTKVSGIGEKKLEAIKDFICV